MKKVFELLFALGFLATNEIIAQTGSLDPDFSVDGKLTLNIAGPGGKSEGLCMAVQEDGKIVVGTSIYFSATGDDFGLARFNPDGSLDTTFGNHGIIKFDLGSKTERIAALKIQSDGKIVVSGGTQQTNPFKVVVAVTRYEENGTLDVSFGNQGVSKISISGLDTPTSMVLQPDGKMIVGGYAQVGNKNYLCFLRLNTSGVLDTTFSQDGKYIQDIGGIKSMLGNFLSPSSVF